MSAFLRGRSSLVLLTLGITACGEPAARQLPPFGEVVLSIDTDAPVPDFVGRLRIDLFDENGRWMNSRDVPRPDPGDWPASFSLYTMDETKPSKALVRVRGYLEGRVRDYLGEQFQERRPYVEPVAADTLVELCANLPELTLGKDLTLRRGSRTLTGLILDEDPSDQAQCRTQMAGGVVAATLNVREAGQYRIETIRVVPDNADPALLIRTDCRNAGTQLACNDDISRDEFTPDFRSRLVLHLDPGSYTVLSGGYLMSASDVTLRADLAASWKDAPAEEAPPSQRGGLPRLVVDNVDVTPKQEPEPHVTIDRLALVTMVPGRKQRASGPGADPVRRDGAGQSGGNHHPRRALLRGGLASRSHLHPGRNVRPRLSPLRALPGQQHAGAFRADEPLLAGQDRGDGRALARRSGARLSQPGLQSF